MEMKSSGVRVTADEEGCVIGQSQNNEEYGYIRVEEVVPVIQEGGWFKYRVRSALIKGKMEDFKKAKFVDGTLLPGKLVVKESLEPFYAENPEKHLKRAGKTGVVCTVNGMPIYRDTIYTENMDEEDELIAHDNGDYIKQHIQLAKCETLEDTGNNLIRLVTNLTRNQSEDE